MRAMPIALRLHAPMALPCDPNCSIIRDAVVDVDAEGRILYCGPRVDAPARPADALVRECSGILLPGLVNSHAHSPMTLLRGMGADLPLLPWLQDVIWPAESRLRPADIRAGMELGCVEMLRAGVTTSAEMYFGGESVVEGVLAVGSRVVLASAVIDTPALSAFGTWQGMVDGISGWIDADGLRFGSGERVELAYGPHSAYTLPPEALETIGGAARQRGALVHTHVAETLQEDVAQREEFGSVPALLEKVGLLGGRVLAAHGVHLSDDDIALFARRGVGVAHCPGSNAKLASGTARLVDLLAAGVAVGLGTDGPSANDDLDLWEEVQLAGLFARTVTGEATALSADAALLAATRGGADAMHRDDIGALEPGRWADVVHLDVDNPAFATGLDAPDDQVLANVVWAAGSRCVRDVWVAGEEVLHDREPTRVDRRRVQAAARTAAAHVRG
ncbi:5-methylthioadenosine/S-adenosylhomocysteine deaminase [Saccharopolyspora erythraea NRRL 2338]|uniref:N-ethylammeline chlorohydrolase n=2 Tax=Saccharopolyspora erythraea TaxID=1836 RepID=A4FQT0_SACEN|nr:amidohydrolase [Saccharopolyspora erythraea]EQD87653.1 ethylammeline chlorohydrolase [Saccharopolyspora erythraea D]PFG93007.1 5-methylthioadenosine/S-adenosylhomocysteine deaminase [Saccharopolyspora erythraea NRRL 2338]QRK89896.1 amidohydrolase [Saccharopolyspora erythraea]CAM06405.1 N-ethylammeline chlorohydrolase [Saccharopolyspora erythraea NRRL 2338]